MTRIGEPSLTCFNALLHAFARSANPHKAEMYLARMREVKVHPDGISFNTLIGAHVRCGDTRKSREVLEDMKRSSVQPTARTFVALGSSSERAGDWRRYGVTCLHLEAMPFDAKYLPEHLRIQLLNEALRLDPDLKEEDMERGIVLQMDDLPEKMNRAISREAFLRDLQWCPRNFLHRYRLAFKDLDDVPQEAIAPLPDDLRQPLGLSIPCGTFGKVA
eukprot:symbB.v1.2.021848.t1/scaffold1913.1/size122320/4